MGISVFGPDVNESFNKFTVNANGDIRFGLAAIKNVGASAVEDIIQERRKNGPFTDIFNFVERVNLSAVNKKNIESLAMAGAFDNFNLKREQFVAVNTKNEIFLDTLIRYGGKLQTDKLMNTNSLFGGENAIEVSKPEIPRCPEWSRIEILSREKELIGMFLSSHPLDDYKFEIDSLVTHQITELEDIASLKGREIILGGLVSAARDNVSKNGNPWGNFTLEDYSGSYEFRLFGKDYEACMQYMQTGLFLLVKAVVQDKWNYGKEPTELELKIKNISLLGNAKDTLKCITLTIPVPEVTPVFANEISGLVKDNPGNIELRMKFIDKEEDRNVEVELFSRKYKIAVTPVLLDFVKNNGLKYYVN